jgi:hypothetical protein
MHWPVLLPTLVGRQTSGATQAGLQVGWLPPEPWQVGAPPVGEAVQVVPLGQGWLAAVLPQTQKGPALVYWQVRGATQPPWQVTVSGTQLG